LRGRLVAAHAVSTEPFAVELELENTSEQPLRVTLGDPFSLSASLEDAGGRPVPPTGSRLDVVSVSETVAIAPGARKRHPLTARHDDVIASLDLVTALWKLAPGRYLLSATWDSHLDGGWGGRLTLPPIEIEQR
jgi:hypothetical protein